MFQLEHRDRIDRGTRPVGDRQRRNRQHEFPSVACGRRLGQRVEIDTVEDVDTEDAQREVMDGVPDIARPPPAAASAA